MHHRGNVQFGMEKLGNVGTRRSPLSEVGLGAGERLEAAASVVVHCAFALALTVARGLRRAATWRQV